MDKEDRAGAGSHRKKEIFDIGLSFAVTRDRQIQVTHLVPGGPAAKLGFVSVGDVIVAIDEEPIPLDSHADLGAFVQSRGQPSPNTLDPRPWTLDPRTCSICVGQPENKQGPRQVAMPIEMMSLGFRV